MAWETKGTRRYYYRVRKIKGRVVRQYAGTGAVGERAAAEDAERRARREEQARARLAERARLQAADGPLDGFCAQTDLLVRAALFAAGYHLADRHWRKRRDPSYQDEAA